MKTKIGTINSGQWDSLMKSFKALDFLPNISIEDGYLNNQLSENSWIEIDYSSTVNWIDFSFLNLTNETKQLLAIPISNKPIAVYDEDNEYTFTNGCAYVSTTKYYGNYKVVNVPIDIYSGKKIIDDVKLQYKSINNITNIPALFKYTQKSGPLDFIITQGTLVSIMNKFGSRIPMVKNAVNDNLNKRPTAIYRSFRFDQFSRAATMCIRLYEVHDDPDWILSTPSTWLYVEMAIDTTVKIKYYERLIPVSKHNWHL